MPCEEDRLSALGDDILRHILYFTPAKEATSTSVLSRRWGSLWRSTGAVNLAVHLKSDGSQFSYSDQRRKDCEEAFFSRRDAFVCTAEAALTATDTRILRFTLHLEADHKDVLDNFVRRTIDSRVERDVVVGPLISHPAARHVEELRITLQDPYDKFERESEVSSYPGPGVFSLGSLPSSKTLRVLYLMRCRKLTLTEPVTFPWLAKLHMQFCGTNVTNLQSLIDAAPGLATVHLDSVLFVPPRNHKSTTEEAPDLCLRLRFPAATTLVLALCTLEVQIKGSCWAIEIEGPMLRYFKYKGRARPFLLRTPAPEMVHVDLHLLHYVYKKDDDRSGDTTRRVFWKFVQNFSNAKILKIKVKHLEHIAAIGKARRTEHLCLLPNVERLQLEGVHDPSSKKGAVAIANLLLCCPALHDLQVKLSTVAADSSSTKDLRYVRTIIARKDQLDYKKSLDCFLDRRSSKPTISFNDQYDEVSDIPGLRGRSFTCLQTSLRRVGLQFRLDKSNCFGVRLIRYFAENALVLEEIAIDSGTRRLLEHMNLNIERWIGPNSSNACLKCKNIPEASWEFSRNLKGITDSSTDLKTSTSGFTVIPLQR